MVYTLPLVEKVVVELRKSNLDNLVDRCHYLFTVALISLFALFNAGGLLFGHPIRCMAPAEYGGGWISFVNEYCFVTSTYVTDAGGFLPDPNGGQMDVSYYQWFAYVLFIQSLLFYAPHFLWSQLLSRADVDVQGVVDGCVGLRAELSVSKKNKSIDGYANYLLKVIGERRRGGKVDDGLGDSATTLYLGMKFLNLANVFLQFHLLNLFVGHGRLTWGFDVVGKALDGVFWDQTGFFPRLAYCKFSRNDLANEVIKEASCVLMLNMVNEKICAFLYFWFLMLFVVSLADFAYALSVFLCKNIRLYNAKRYLNNMKQCAPSVVPTTENKEAFVMEVLGMDGLLLLQFIDDHAGILIASQVACRLFELFHESRHGAGGGGDEGRFDGFAQDLYKGGHLSVGDGNTVTDTTNEDFFSQLLEKELVNEYD